MSNAITIVAISLFRRPFAYLKDGPRKTAQIFATFRRQPVSLAPLPAAEEVGVGFRLRIFLQKAAFSSPVLWPQPTTTITLNNQACRQWNALNVDHVNAG